jgi:hypothetical protein
MTIFVPKTTLSFPLDDKGNVVQIKARFSLADNAKIQAELLEMRSKDGKNVTFHTSGELGQKLAILRVGIKGWSGEMFTDEHGRAVPYSPAILDDLDLNECRWWIDKVAEKLDELNRPAGGTDPKAEPST